MFVLQDNDKTKVNSNIFFFLYRYTIYNKKHIRRGKNLYFFKYILITKYNYCIHLIVLIVNFVIFKKI